VATARYLTAIFAAGMAAVLLNGCGGSQGSITPAASTQVAPMVKNHCSAHGGVRVTPCSVDLTASNPGPDTVVVRTPQRKKGTLSEQDTCGGASGIATVTQGSGDSWIVTAGATTGSCTATFNFASGKKGKIVGWATLAITNSI
jgi:hypothetical protein